MPVSSLCAGLYLFGSDESEQVRVDCSRTGCLSRRSTGDVHGAKMFFKGLPESRDRADVIAYLTTLK